MNLPKSWNELRVIDFIDLHQLKSQELGVVERYIEILFIVSGEEIEVIEEMSVQGITKAVRSIPFLTKEPHKNFKRELGEYRLTPFTKLTWGEFIDLEYYCSQDYYINLPTICGILYKKTKIDEWNNEIIEPYIYDPKKRGEEFEEMIITDLFGALHGYINWRNSIVNDKYKYLFNPEIDGTDEDLDEEDRKAEELEKRLEKWAYEKLTYELAGSDLTKMGSVFDLPILFVLNMLSMSKELT